MRVALVHYWLTGMRGGEKVLEAFCRLFPHADIFTHVYDPNSVSETIRRHHIQTTFISRLPFPTKLYKKYLPLMPMALEELDLTGYDLIISSEAGPSKGIIPSPNSVHLCYTHSPMRYIWDQYITYKQDAGILTRFTMPLFCKSLRMWDVTSSARVDSFIANSTHVANRILKYYRRDSEIVHPPVAVDSFFSVSKEHLENYYLWAGEFVSYKRPDIAVKAFNKLKLPLFVIGDGVNNKRLKKNGR